MEARLGSARKEGAQRKKERTERGSVRKEGAYGKRERTVRGSIRKEGEYGKRERKFALRAGAHLKKRAH